MTFPEYCARQAAKAFGAAVFTIVAGVALGVLIAKYLKKRQAANEGGAT
jgi:hypothetical protein